MRRASARRVTRRRPAPTAPYPLYGPSYDPTADPPPPAPQEPTPLLGVGRLRGAVPRPDGRLVAGLEARLVAGHLRLLAPPGPHRPHQPARLPPSFPLYASP